LAEEQYLKRHVRLCVRLHFNVCYEIGVKLDNQHWYNHVPKSVETIHDCKVTILWNQQVGTDITIPNNKLDIIIHDNKTGTYMLIDVAICGDRNIIKKEDEKILKYEDLIIEIQCTWNLKEKVIPVITGATASISKSLSNISGKHEIKELQKKNSHIGHCTHTTESVKVNVQNIFHGRNNIISSTDCKYRTAATLDTLEKWFVSGIYL